MLRPIPLAPSLRRRLYEPLILLDALKTIYHKNGTTTTPDLESGTGRSSKETYFCFVNKLSQICDSRGKEELGKTVSAVAVLDSGTIEYRLASNLREDREMEEVAEYLLSILDILKGVEEKQLRDKKFMDPIFSDILRRVLAFNRPRVADYVESLYRQRDDGTNRLEFGINFANTDGTTAGESAPQHCGSLADADWDIQGATLPRHWGASSHFSRRQETPATMPSVSFHQHTSHPKAPRA